MTPSSLNNLTDAEKRVRIAEACGWTDCRPRASMMDDRPWIGGINPRPDKIEGIIDAETGEERAATAEDYQLPTPVPDYLNDLNAMAEAEATLGQMQCFTYRDILQSMVLKEVAMRSTDFVFGATARQRAEAFLATIAP